MEHLSKLIRDIPNFPKEGILFKDITPLFSSAESIASTRIELVRSIIEAIDVDIPIDVIVGIESRGFLFCPAMAEDLEASFALARKPGKLPYEKISTSYDLEYGSTSIEMHTDSIKPGQKVIIHDDLLATGGTALAAAELVKQLGGEVIGFSFIVELEFLKGAQKIKEQLGDDVKVISVLKY